MKDRDTTDVRQETKFERFKALHEADGAFVMANPWDAGTARILSALGFSALGTTSAGFAFSVGRRDSFAGLGRTELLENAKSIVDATDLPSQSMPRLRLFSFRSSLLGR